MLRRRSSVRIWAAPGTTGLSRSMGASKAKDWPFSWQKLAWLNGALGEAVAEKNTTAKTFFLSGNNSVIAFGSGGAGGAVTRKIFVSKNQKFVVN